VGKVLQDNVAGGSKRMRAGSATTRDCKLKQQSGADELAQRECCKMVKSTSAPSGVISVG